ncbi:hypothetical protein [Algoriphagus marincola]|uniref:hypothetical protein n=1 Tax=Algoriphagus marincola TaxID=264027 RepID=UPI0012DCF519|nr:hypothetical protein [Algoriphagus marincola]
MAHIYRIVSALMQHAQYHYSSMLSKTDIKNLKKRLPRGYFKKVSEKSQLSQRSVSNFFESKIYNAEIHQVVLDIIEEFEAEKAEILARQKSLLHAK